MASELSSDTASDYASSSSDVSSSGRQLYGAFSGHGGGGYGGGHGGCCCDKKDSKLYELLAIGIAVYALVQALMMKGKKRRRRSDGIRGDYLTEHYADSLGLIGRVLMEGNGLDDFEERIDKLVSNGLGEQDNSWIGKLYRSAKSSLTDGDGDETKEEGYAGNAADTGPTDGIEPPLLISTWGLNDKEKNSTTSDNSTSAFASTSDQSAYNYASNDVSSEGSDVSGGLLEGSDVPGGLLEGVISGLTDISRCKLAFWRCVANVARGSASMNGEKGGLSGLFHKAVMRVAFHSKYGNAWNALMTIPEAREVRRCMSAQDKCLEYELLRTEAALSSGAEINANPRLIVNPDFVERQDTSDGKEQFDPDVLQKYNDALESD